MLIIMMKSYIIPYIMNLYPILINIFMLLIFSIPSKNNKFNPINLMFFLIFLTLLTSLKLNYLINSWSSFILFLIMIGGLMIIFMYITSLANNELFTYNFNYLLINIFKMILMLFMIMMFYYYFNNLMNWNNSNMNFNLNYSIYIKFNFHEMYNKFYNYNNFFIMIYLFYSMICIMNICYKFKLPLRQLYF